MQHIEFNLKTKDHLQLYTQSWLPEKAPKAIISLVHGLGEHSGRYAHLATYLTQAGYALLAFDLRGHGKSDGQRGHAPSYSIVMEDIDLFLKETVQRYPHCPGFLYGHSLGGNLVINYVLRYRPPLRGAIATGPALQPAVEPSFWKLLVGNLMYHIRPTLSLPAGLNTQAISRNPEVVQQYQQDKLVHNQVTVGFGLDILEAGEWALQYAAEFSLPLLLMQGSEDHLTLVQASREFAIKVGQRCTLKIWENLYHEIHHEPEQEQVFTYLLDWLRKWIMDNE